jgi:hypothetical protein
VFLFVSGNRTRKKTYLREMMSCLTSWRGRAVLLLFPFVITGPVETENAFLWLSVITAFMWMSTFLWFLVCLGSFYTAKILNSKDDSDDACVTGCPWRFHIVLISQGHRERKLRKNHSFV